MKARIVADSSANLQSIEGVDFVSAPLKIITEYKEYVDDASTDPVQMMKELEIYKGKDGTSCPNVADWLDAFGDSQYIFGVSITSHLSGAYNSAKIAADEYMEEHPGTRVHIFDSLSVGPEAELIIDRIRKMTEKYDDFDLIVEKVNAYMKRTHLLFILGSLNALAKNGRVNPAIAKIAGVLNIKIVGKASDEGELQILHKCRGENKAIVQLWESMKEMGYKGGRVIIRHTVNSHAAEELKKLIQKEFPLSEISIGINGALCSYYAQMHGLLLGFESAKKQELPSQA